MDELQQQIVELTNKVNDLEAKYSKDQFSNNVITRKDLIMQNGSYSSNNFVTGSAGWQIDAEGNLEANNGTFRGSITGATGAFAGTVSASNITAGTISSKAINLAISTAVTLVDSYSETNWDNSAISYDTSTYEFVGQSFANTSQGVLNSCKFYLSKQGSPTGNCFAAIYAHTGTFGTTGKPTGSALATSDAVNVTSLTTSNVLTTFTFSGANLITLSASTKYVVIFNYSSGDVSNYVKVGIDTSTPSHAGITSFSNDGVTWSVQSSDTIFYLYSTIGAGNSYIASGKTAFNNTVSGFILGVDDADNDTPKFYIGNSTNYLNWDGSEFLYTGKTRTTIKISTIFESSGRFTTSGNGITFDTTGITVQPHATVVANNSSDLKVVISGGSSLDVITGTVFSVYCHLATIDTVTAGNNGAFYVGTNEGTINGTTIDLTGTKQYGFKALKTAGVVQLYATCSDGAAETTTLLSTITTAFYGLLSAISDGTRIRYYQDNTLVATHTTHVPSANLQNWCWGTAITNLNTAFDFNFNINSMSFEKFVGFS